MQKSGIVTGSLSIMKSMGFTHLLTLVADKGNGRQKARSRATMFTISRYHSSWFGRFRLFSITPKLP